MPEQPLSAPSKSTVWIVFRDDGSSQVAEESVDSVWASENDAEKRAAEIMEKTRVGLLPWDTRYERWVVR